MSTSNIAAKANTLFRLAARAWEDGNNSGNALILYQCEERCEKLRQQAEDLLAPLGITVDYPGLYPTFKVGGCDYYTTESAVKAAMEKDRRMPKNYFVSWETELVADCARDAAELALKIHRDPNSLATVFRVWDEDGREETIDLIDGERQ